MASAIHLTAAGDTLNSLSEAYYSLFNANGRLRTTSRSRVIHAIRRATPATAGFDLSLDPSDGAASSFADDADLGAGQVVHVPTLRAFPRNIVGANAAAVTALREAGFVDGRRLIERDREEVVAYVLQMATAGGWTGDDVREAYRRTQALSLDGMDLLSLEHLSSLGLHGWDDISSASPATLATHLQSLVDAGGQHASVLTQGHESRWRKESTLQTAHDSAGLPSVPSDSWVFGVPIQPRQFAAVKQHFRGLLCGQCLASDERAAAEVLALVGAVSEHLMRGNLATLARRPKEAFGHYVRVRTLVHRYAESVGIASAVPDRTGLSTSVVAEVSHAALSSLPDGDPALLGGPCLRSEHRSMTAPWGVDGFHLSEATSGTVEAVRVATTGVPIHRLPLGLSEAIWCALRDRTFADLTAANAALVVGVSGPPDGRIRDDSEATQGVVRRNVLAFGIGNLLASGLSIHTDSRVSQLLTLSSLSAALDSPPSLGTGAAVLQAGAQASYPAHILSGSWSQRFVRMPRGHHDPDTLFVRLGASPQDYSASFDSDFLAAILGTEDLGARYLPQSFWLSPSAIAGALPWLYGILTTAGIARAHARMGSTDGGPKDMTATWPVPIYDTDGSMRSEGGYKKDSSSPFTDVELLGNADASGPYFVLPLEQVRSLLLEGDANYRLNEMALAAQKYREVVDAANAATATYDTVEAAEAVDDIIHWNSGGGGGPPGNTDGVVPYAITYFDFDSMSGGSVSEDQGLFRSGKGPPEVGQFSGLSSVTPSDGPIHLLMEGVPGKTVSVTTETANGTATYYSGEPSVAAAYIALQLTAEARLVLIERGLLMNGFQPDFVPPWETSWLLDAARHMIAVALGAEGRLFNVLQMYETAELVEMEATSAQKISVERVNVAGAQYDEAAHRASAANHAVDAAEKDLEVIERQQDAAKVMAWVGVGIAAAAATVVTFGAAAAAAAAAAAGATVAVSSGAVALNTTAAAVGASGAVGTAYGGNKRQRAVRASATSTSERAKADRDAAMSGLTAAGFLHDVAVLEALASTELQQWLTKERRLTAEALSHLLELSSEIASQHVENAARLAWLAQRALSVETRRVLRVVKVDYSSSFEPLSDLTRAQRLQRDLEQLVTSHVIAEQERRQLIKLTLPLSAWFPDALLELRASGEGGFAIGHELLDGLYPGHFLHSLQHIEVRFIGTLPSSSVRGMLQMGGASFVRVPNEPAYTEDSYTVADWTDAALQVSPDEALGPWVLKQVPGPMLEQTLSEFDQRGDETVLRLPVGQLGQAQHLGLDASYVLRVWPTANAFRYTDIADVEVTFSFLALYDAALEERIIDARRTLASTGQDLRTSELAWRALMLGQALPDEARATGSPLVLQGTSAPDDMPLEEVADSQVATNLVLRVPIDQGLGLVARIAHESEPSGVAVVLDDDVVYTADYGFLPASEQPVLPAQWPAASAALSSWLGSNIGGGGQTFFGRWAVKLEPSKQSDDWHARNGDGSFVEPAHGPLVATGGGQAEWLGNPQLTDVAVAVRLTLASATSFSCRLRVVGGDHYGLSITGTEVELVRSSGGTATVLQSRSLVAAFPTDEQLELTLHVANDETSGPDAVVLRAFVDGMPLIEATDSSPALASGALVLQSAGAVELHGVRVTELGLLGHVGALLLDEPFAAEPTDWSIPASWTFSSGSGMRVLDLRRLQGVSIVVEYRYEHS